MPPDILIVGQGIAGTMLGWELERAGIPFGIADPGHSAAATLVGAGLINPVTGRRLVKSWRIDALLPAARLAYQSIEGALGIPLWHPMRIRRVFAEAAERRAFNQKFERGELSPYVDTAADDQGFWIGGAARIDLARLLAASRERWASRGILRDERIGSAASGRALVIDCTGWHGTRGGFAFVPWEYSKGEALEIAAEGLEPDVVINRRQAVVPLGPGRAWVGATHEPGVTEAEPTREGRALLETAARSLLARHIEVRAHRAALRVTLPDKRPLAGRHPENHRLGVVNGLGGKGALWAPMLARQWVDHLGKGGPFDPEVAVARFFGCISSQASPR